MEARPWLRLLILTLLVSAAVAAAWFASHRRRLAAQWGSYRVGRAETLKEAVAIIDQLEQEPDPAQHLRELTGKWGTGNQRFDLYLAEHVRSADSSELVRQTFSLEMAWRREILPRWAHYWSWQSADEPDQQIASIVDYLDVLVAAEPPRQLTWREVLDLQAVLELAGSPDLAVRLTPENWRDRYRSWQRSRPPRLPHVDRPETPFPDWQGPLPERHDLAGQQP